MYLYGHANKACFCWKREKALLAGEYEEEKSHILLFFFFLFACLEKGLFDRACSSEEVNILIHDELKPDEGFHGLYEKAIDSLEKKLRKVLPNTFYGIHSFIEVSGETALQSPN